MTEFKALRNAGDFPNKSMVEYATIRVEIPHRLIASSPQICGIPTIGMKIS